MTGAISRGRHEPAPDGRWGPAVPEPGTLQRDRSDVILAHRLDARRRRRV